MSSNPFATPRASADLEDDAGPIPHRGPVKADLRPIELLKRGKDLISDQYWTFFGVTGLGILVGSAAPFGIILGPMMCGMYLCLVRKARGDDSVTVNDLFKGFDFFKQGFIAMMIGTVAILLAIVPFMIALVVTIRSDPDGFIAVLLSMYAVIFALSMVVNVFMMFAFPLIADRGYTAIDALKTSFRAAKMNLGGLLLLSLTSAVVGLILALMCYVPAFLFMPVSFAAFTLAYLEIFPDAE
ncbi:MAG: hypothetical protein RIT81_01575 [Deltaproteobacteria bacterium]